MYPRPARPSDLTLAVVSGFLAWSLHREFVSPSGAESALAGLLLEDAGIVAEALHRCIPRRRINGVARR